MSLKRKWEVRFFGDPDYGHETWDTANPVDTTIVPAVDASTAARKALAEWRREDKIATEEGFYGDGTIVGVQEVVEPPPVKTFIVDNGRPKLERP